MSNSAENDIDHQIEIATCKIIILVVKLPSNNQSCDCDIENVYKAENDNVEDCDVGLLTELLSMLICKLKEGPDCP